MLINGALIDVISGLTKKYATAMLNELFTAARNGGDAIKQPFIYLF